MEHVKDDDADVVFFSETWMESDKNDITAELESYGYKFCHNRRRNLGGGVGILLKITLFHKHISSKSFSSFEHTIVKIQLKDNTKLTMISIYRLQFVATNIFLEEFTELLEILSSPGHI